MKTRYIENRTGEIMHLIENLKTHLRTYTACGNILGIVPLGEAGFSENFDFSKSTELRSFLADWGKQIGSDSVMVLTGSPEKFHSQGYHVGMYVFEPNGSDESGMDGGISTMCGNGVRAVAAYVRERISQEATNAQIMTMSGLRAIEWDQEMYAVQMGVMTNRPVDLAKYVNTNLIEPNQEGLYIHSPIPDSIRQDLSRYTAAQRWSIGLNGDYDESGAIDGEPHVIIEVPINEISSIEELRKLAVQAGPIITKNTHLFPQEINVNFIVIDSETEASELLNCTHERNLGDDPEHSVTAACGTGSTVAGGVTLLTHTSLRQVSVQCTGGGMQIIANPDSTLVMRGPAQALE